MTAVLLTSSLLILLIAALRPLLRGRIDPRWQYALWLVAALRLLVPVDLADSAYSALALLDRAEEPARVAEAIGQTTVPILAMSPESATIQASQEYGEHDGVVRLEPSKQVQDRAEELMRGPTLSELAGTYARPVWLGGAALMGAWFLLVDLRLRRKLRAAIPVEADCPLPVYVTLELPSPCLCGAVRPAVYVTPAALADPDRLRHVLAHELTHYRHKDHWWALVRCLCLCLYWFDPLVWWAAALSRQDCELACDEGAIRRLGEGERLPYGRTLVDMIAAGRNSLLNTATTMTGSKRKVKERIQLIARKPKTALAAALALAVIVTCAVGCTFTGAPEGPDPEPSGTTDPEPLPSDELTADTLAARLLDIPEELRDNVEARPHDGTLAVYYFKHPGEAVDEAQYLLIVSERSEEDLQKLYAERYSASGNHWFAKRGSCYYLFQWNTSIEYDLEDEEQFNAALRAVQEFAKYTVLDTVGVEPFDLDSFQPEDAPSPAQQTIQSVMDEIINAPSVELTLAPAGMSRVYVYPTDIQNSYWAYRMDAFASYFQWEEFDWGTTEDPHFPPTSQSGTSLRVNTPDYSAYILVWEDSDLIAVHDNVSGTNWYHGKSADGDERLGVYWMWSSPYGALRYWFDVVEADLLRTTTTIPDRGQSHEDIAREWTENWEGAYTKCAPGSQYARTYVRVENVKADVFDWMDEEVFAEFAQSRGFSGEEYGKTWFGFCYDTVFVPVYQSTDGPQWAGNTRYYEGDDAPEGALVNSHVGYMELIDGNWTCEGVGTGW